MLKVRVSNIWHIFYPLHIDFLSSDWSEENESYMVYFPFEYCQQLNVIVLVINRGIKVISVLISDPLPRSYGVCKAYTCIQCIYM